MQILFTILDDWRRDQRDIWLEGDASTPFSAVAERLDEEADRQIHEPWWDGDRLLEAEAAIGTEILEGSTLSRRPPDRISSSSSPAGELRAVSGPHAGSTWPLPSGRHLIGRSDEATINLVRDPLVSRRHAVLDVTPAGLTVHDEGSAHGLTLEGEFVTDSDLHDGALLQVGGSVLVWHANELDSAVLVPDGEGGLVFNRPPRMLNSPSPVTVRFPGPPPVQHGVNFPLIASVAPVILGVLLAVVLKQPQFLLFILLTPIMAVSSYVTQRRGGSRSHRERTSAYEQAQAHAEADLAAAASAETTRRREASPDPAALAATATGPQRSLWERRRRDDDFLVVRIGLADLPASITVEGAATVEQARPARPARPAGPGTEAGPAGHAGPAGYAGSAGPVDGHPLLHQIPAVVELQRDGVLGIAGDRRACEELANSLVMQAAVLHAPDDLVITVLTGPHQKEKWAWCRWLPHARDREGRSIARIGTIEAGVVRLAGELSAVIDDRTSAKNTNRGDPPPAHLVIIDGSYRLGALPVVTKILRRGPEAGISCICLDDTERLLPEECQAVAVFDPDRPGRLSLRTGRETKATDVIPDLVDHDSAEKVSRSLAPIRLNRRAFAGATIPASVRLLDELGLEPPAGAQIGAGWHRTARSTAAVIGESERGPLVVDLAKDGPHGLVAGTTGAGKSELLQTLIASLAVANRPDCMNFVLVDYKGGSAFKECAELPHTVGMVTDLDGHLTERALSSLAAELRRRELLLAQRGAKDIEAFWRSADGSGPALGRLVIVIDEFAALAEELPAFVDGLVDLARRGRSLGIHLILATQRPSGVVSAAIKTNTNLRIAMRITDAADSTDVIDSPLAARIAKSVPGRGYVRVGHEELTEFQAARIGGRRALGGQSELQLHYVAWDQLGMPLPEPERPVLARDATDLSELVKAIRAAADALGVTPPAGPWLEPLPERLVLSSAALTPAFEGGANGPVLGAPYGMQDLPGEQTRRPATFDLERDGHLLIVGDPGSGRSTALRTMAGALCARVSAWDLHLYGIDCGNGALQPVSELPQCGAVVTRRQPDRVDRLMSKLAEEITRRQQIMAQGRFSSISDQRAAVSPEQRLPYILVLLDRWEGFTAEFEALDGGRLVSAVQHLMREGPGVGLRLVVTGDRTATSPRFASLAERMIMLRLNDRTTYSMAGLNPRHLPDKIPTGRGFDARNGIEMQFALLDGDASGPAQVAALHRIALRADDRDRAVPESARPQPIAVLPAHVSLSSVTKDSDAPSETGRPVALVGVGGDRLTPQLIDLTRSGPGFLVAGPPRSGRSNALVVMARSLAGQGCSVVAVTARPSPLTNLRDEPRIAAILDGRATTPADLEALLDSISDVPVGVVVDDAELLSDSPIGEALAAFGRAARDKGDALIIGGTTGDLGAFRGFIPEVRKSRAGLLLCPSSPSDADLLGARLPRTAVFNGPPGRGALIAEWDMQIVQVPFDDRAG
jgi:DNA segregation ATPase FtsK/SpoIIIE, S-DNA-T family